MTPAVQATAFAVGDGFVIVPEFSLTGGVHTSSTRKGRRKVNDGQGVEAKYDVTKRVEDVRRYKQGVALRTRAYYLTDRHCVNTPLGYWLPREKQTAYELDMAHLGHEVFAFNDEATRADSDIRMTCTWFKLELHTDLQAACERLARLVRERLQCLSAALVSGERKVFEAEWERCHNLEKLATGIQREAIEQALDTARHLKGVMLEALRTGGSLPTVADVDPILATERLFY
jgi:hypothetical protein